MWKFKIFQQVYIYTSYLCGIYLNKRGSSPTENGTSLKNKSFTLTRNVRRWGATAMLKVMGGGKEGSPMFKVMGGGGEGRQQFSRWWEGGGGGGGTGRQPCSRWWQRVGTLCRPVKRDTLSNIVSCFLMSHQQAHMTTSNLQLSHIYIC